MIDRADDVAGRPVTPSFERTVEGKFLTDSPRRVTELPEALPVPGAPGVSRTVAGLLAEDPAGRSCDLVTTLAAPAPLPAPRPGETATLRRFSREPLCPRLSGTRWLG